MREEEACSQQIVIFCIFSICTCNCWFPDSCKSVDPVDGFIGGVCGGLGGSILVEWTDPAPDLLENHSLGVLQTMLRGIWPPRIISSCSHTRDLVKFFKHFFHLWEDQTSLHVEVLKYTYELLNYLLKFSRYLLTLFIIDMSH